MHIYICFSYSPAAAIWYLDLVSDLQLLVKMGALSCNVNWPKIRSFYESYCRWAFTHPKQNIIYVYIYKGYMYSCFNFEQKGEREVKNVSANLLTFKALKPVMKKQFG